MEIRAQFVIFSREGFPVPGRTRKPVASDLQALVPVLEELYEEEQEDFSWNPDREAFVCKL